MTNRYVRPIRQAVTAYFSNDARFNVRPGTGMWTLRILLLPLIVGVYSIAAVSMAQGQGAPLRQSSVLRRLPPLVTASDAWQSNWLDQDACGNEQAEAIDFETLKDLAWRKDGFRLLPYGYLAADMIYNTQRTNTGAYTTYVFSAEDQGEGAFIIDARRSRVGLELTGPRIAQLGDADSRGRLEIDFFGEFITENQPGVLLRQAYWEVERPEYRLLVGQTWDVISPLNPNTLNYGVGLLTGNIGYRRTQFRAERYLNFSDTFQATLQGALSQGIVTDFSADPNVRRDASNWPVVQARAALAFGPRGEDQQPIVVGCSGHIGETGFDFLTAGPPPLNLPPQDDARFRTWSLNADLYAPINDRCGLQGEFFTGANLSAFLGGIGQGVCPCQRVPIRSAGGWAEVWYHWTPRLTSYAGFGLEDPNDKDFVEGRFYNRFIFANLIFDVTDELTAGIEVTSWKTLYRRAPIGPFPPDPSAPSEPGNAVVIECLVKYSF